MGIQDFNPAVQKIIRRIQPYEQTKATFDLCRQLAFESINIDLIYGCRCRRLKVFWIPSTRSSLLARIAWRCSAMRMFRG